jgi:hypothetical protein
MIFVFHFCLSILLSDRFMRREMFSSPEHQRSPPLVDMILPKCYCGILCSLLEETSGGKHKHRTMVVSTLLKSSSVFRYLYRFIQRQYTCHACSSLIIIAQKGTESQSYNSLELWKQSTTPQKKRDRKIRAQGSLGGVNFHVKFFLIFLCTAMARAFALCYSFIIYCR